MNENEGASREPETLPPTREEELARKAAKLVKAGKPQFKRLVAFTRPRAETAGRQAAQYVRDHEPELKQAAARLVRARIRGPLGMVVDQFTQAQKSPQPASCFGCGTVYQPGAKFCGECGTRLIPDSPAEP